MIEGNRICIFISFSGQGGVELMVTNLAQGFLDAGLDVDMVLVKTHGEHIKAIPAGVRTIELAARHTWTGLTGLARYIRQEQPTAILAAKDRAIRVAVLARRLAGSSAPLVGRLGTTISAALEGKSRIRKLVWFGGMRLFYRRVDRLVAVSEGVADDIRRITRLSDDRIMVVRNPVVTPSLYKLAREPSPHPWLNNSDLPVILSVGRLTRQKDFTTLIRAFAFLRRSQECRLIILGEGRDRASLENLTRDLRLSDDIVLPGFTGNPYSFIARCSLFVLSSRWEGSPNALTESLALGIPVVSTDCPSGPREILQGGRYGKLVPVGDHEALASAMAVTMDDHLPSQVLKEAVSEYTVSKSAEGYLEALGLL